MNELDFPVVPVNGVIRLGQFLKFAGLADSGVDARMLIQDGDVSVNGVVDTRRGRQLTSGDLVTIVLPGGTIGASVGS